VTNPAAGDTDAPPRLRTAIATVCISGTLEDKLTAAAAAGFDGVEIFEPDFVVSPMSAAEVRTRCADLGLSIDLYQPFRDLDSVRPEGFTANLRRIERKFDVMERLGTDQVLVCSANYPDASNDDDQIAEQLHSAAVKAHERGLRPLPGEHMSTPTSVPGILSAPPTIRLLACASTVSTSCPAAPTRPGSRRFRARSCSSCNWPMPPIWTWICCSGAGTTGCSRVRAPLI
jgi:hypothetical protein